MFETVGRFFDGVRSFFKTGYNYISEKASDVVNYIGSAAKKVIEAPEKIVKTIHNDAAKIISGANTDFNKILDRGSETVNNVINKGGEVIQSGQKAIAGSVTSVGQSLSTPLVIGASILAALLILKK